MNSIHKFIDHTLLKPEAHQNDYLKLFQEARDYHFFAVCVPPSLVELAIQHLNETSVKICTVNGFPLGYQTTQTKFSEAQESLLLGADEIDTVINITWVKDGSWVRIQNELKSLSSLCHDRKDKKILKVILETCLLTQAEIQKCCEVAEKAQVDFVKTSTGFSKAGAQLNDVKLMRATLSPHIQIKASGGIKSRADALAFIEAGATRLGTSSGVQIVKGFETTQNSY
jgi:deoxyribose-phosphate aldolase